MVRDPIYVIALIVVGFIGKGCYDKKQQELGAVKALLGVTIAQRDTAKRSADSAKLAYRRDTIRLAGKIVYRDSIVAKVDTQFLDRNIPVPVEVVKEIIKADSQALNACQIVRRTCEERVALVQRDLDGANRQINLLKRTSNRSLVAKAKTATVWMGIGIFSYLVIK